MKTDERNYKAKAITIKGMLLNIFLIATKLIAGIVGKSSAMIADAIHSVSDIITDVVVIAGTTMGSKPKDKNHHYGHGKIETLSTVIIGLTLLIAAIYIFYSGTSIIIGSFKGNIIEAPKMIALYVAGVSIVSKEIIFRYTLTVGKKINSKAVVANAWHHRSDAYTSIGTFIGIGGAIFLGQKWHILDPIAALVVSLFIAKVSYSIIAENIKELIETALPHSVEEKILSVASGVEGVIYPHNLKTRSVGNNIVIDMHIYVNETLSIVQAHDISLNLEQKLKSHFGDDTIISIHVEPQN